jgi:hypothetical protein
MCRAEFNVPCDALPTLVWLGEVPETVFEAHLNRYNIYLARDSDRWQFMYSGSHEAFHRVCSGQVGYHWADEMFAVLFSLLYLTRINEVTHAARNRARHVELAENFSSREMFAGAGNPLSPEFYGRAYVVGQALVERVGWDTLKPLAVMRTAEGNPDVDQWLDTLPAESRENVRSILGR